MKGMVAAPSGSSVTWVHTTIMRWIKERHDYDIELSNVMDLPGEGADVTMKGQTLDSRTPK